MVSVRVPAKINLALGVGPRRDDGYHPLATVYHAVDLCDEVNAYPSDDASVSVDTHFDGRENAVIPAGDGNLAVRAALALREYAGTEAGARLAIRKVIPVAGGMAGGSADAAAALTACADLWELSVTRETLEHIAAEIGSDVPFLLHGGTAMGDGRGERVSPVLARGFYTWVLALQEHGLSTAEVFAEFDRLDVRQHAPSVPDELLTALRAGDAELLGPALSNDLHEAALSLSPRLERVFEIGGQCEALGSVLCGSGPTIAFLAADDRHATDIAVALAASNACADVVTASGPVPGARRIT